MSGIFIFVKSGNRIPSVVYDKCLPLSLLQDSVPFSPWQVPDPRMVFLLWTPLQIPALPRPAFGAPTTGMTHPCVLQRCHNSYLFFLRKQSSWSLISFPSVISVTGVFPHLLPSPRGSTPTWWYCDRTWTLCSLPFRCPDSLLINFKSP